jgi:hypothetical protein
MIAEYHSSNKILGDYIVNKSNRNQDKTNTIAGTTKEVSRNNLFKSAIIGGNCGNGRGNGNGNGYANGNAGGNGYRPFEDGADDIFN